MATTRKPPLPDHFNIVVKGQCRYCNGLIIKNGKPSTRATWHKHCVEEYRLLHWPAYTRRKVMARDRCRCNNCQTISKKWHVDHIMPLYLANGNLDFWRMNNLQTLCESCHKEKSKREAQDRAQKRKDEKDNKKPLE